MVKELPDFDIPYSFGLWLLVLFVGAVVALLVGLAVAYSLHGSRAFRMTAQALRNGIRDFTRMSFRRISAISILTFKEALRRKAFAIGFLFVLLFMFGGWFINPSDPEVPAKYYVTLVMTAMYFLLMPMALLVACWGIPADIKARSLHTVVTKPVRRNEIVLGRMGGYLAVISVVLIGVSVLGYLWIRQQVPERATSQLIARVPQYGHLEFISREGNRLDRGIQVGDVWDYRQFVEGGTQGRGVWDFHNLDVSTLQSLDHLSLEQKFEAFRTFKGVVDDQVRFSVWLFNPETDLRVLVGTYPVEEHSNSTTAAVIQIPKVLKYRDSYDINAPEKSADLFKDLIHDQTLTVEIGCVEQQQYLGVAENDLFLRLPDHSFGASYAKACFSLWLLLALMIVIGTTASCFLKGPVATISTATLIVVGYVFRDQLEETLYQFQQYHDVMGGGPFESIYRLVTRMNQVADLPENLGTSIIQGADTAAFGVLHVVYVLIPNLKIFNSSVYPANGFDVPWDNALIPSLLITLGFFIPLSVLGYFSLQFRELEHK